MNRLEEKYRKEVVPSLMERHNYKTVMLVPKIEKIVVNMGVGDAIANSKNLEAAVADLEKITGLKPVETKAKIGLQNSKAVIAYDKITLDFVKEFVSAAEAMTWLVENKKANNLNASMLIKSCKNKVKSADGYV